MRMPITRLIFVGPTPAPCRRARGRVGGGDEGVRAVVDVEQRALAALEEDHLVVLQRWLMTRTVSVTYGFSCSA